MLSAVLLLALVAALLVAPVRPAAAATCTKNAIACENELPGTPRSQWDIDGVGDTTIQGFATSTSVNAGSAISFKVDTDASSYSVKIYRLGYYQGDGAREIDTFAPSATLPQDQPDCATSTDTEILDCGTWAVSASWNVPATAVSGVYIALLIRGDTGGASHIPFVVRHDGNTSDVVMQTSESTWQAYNTYGGSDFYQGNDNGRSYKVSFNRPYATRAWQSGRDFLFANEYPMIRFLEQNGYDVSYVSGLDVATDPALLGKHKTFLSVGHDEYWSGGQRTNVTAARDGGTNLAFFSGNEVYWKTRWEPSEDGAATPNRTLVCYKDSWGNGVTPVTPDGEELTPTWRDPRFGDLGHGPENSLTGTMYMANYGDLPVTVNSAEGKLRLWRNSTLTSLASGDSAPLADHTVGYESDEDLDNGYRPAGLFNLSTTVGHTPEYVRGFGKEDVVEGTTTHHLTSYRAPSGALVFGAGTVQWSWGLDDEHDGITEPADPRMRQATVNVLADMGALATTIADDLVASSTSSDTTPPTTTISAPVAGSSVAAGSLITVKGTASDVGGRVGGVEVSVDGGATFHPAVGRESWSYTDILTGTGDNAIQARATDDSGRIQTTPSRVAVDAPCPCSIFGAMTPLRDDALDPTPSTLGTRFKSSSNGFITGVRFYKSVANTGSHKGTLYDSDGRVLGSGVFSNETASGWQLLNFTTAVPVTAGATYVAAYTAPHGHYAADSRYFSSRSHTADTLTAPGGSANPNGVFADGDAFPRNSYLQSNYYVDAVFNQTNTTPLTVSEVSPMTGATSVLSTAKVSVTFSRALSPCTATLSVLDADNTPVAGDTTYDSACRTATFSPEQPLATSTQYTVTATGRAGSIGLAAPYQWSFTTVAPAAAAGICPCTLYDESDQPTIRADESSAVQLGTAFTVSAAGVVSGMRFFKAAENTGEHVVKLWSSTGEELARATTVNESTTGWQQAMFDSPIEVSTGQTYIASYTAPNGHYSYLAGGLSAKISRPPVSSVTTGGRYSYGTAALTGTSTAGYFVDPVYNALPGRAPVVRSVRPGDHATSVPVDAAIGVTFVDDVQPNTAVVSLTSADGVAVPGNGNSETVGSTASFTPTSPLEAGTRYTVRVSGARSQSGTPMSAPVTTSFTTAGAAACPCSLLESTSQPTVSDSDDPTPTTLGLRFTPSVDGFVKGIRYFRDAANTGTHVGRLYPAGGGSPLASVTFTEQAAGWQTANFSRAVPVKAGTTYVASYLAPNGHYSMSSRYFDNPVVNAPLAAATSAGVYSDGDKFPSSTFGNNHYYVDVVFTTSDTDAPDVTSFVPRPADRAAVGTTISATFERPVLESTIAFSVTGPDGAVSGQLSYAEDTHKATFTPAVDLAPGATYDVSVTATSTSGVGMDNPKTWSFSTTGTEPAGQPVSLFGTNATPGVEQWDDPGPVTVGVKFSSTSAGEVTAIRFYAGPGNTGTQTVSLYSEAGSELATGTSSGTGTGWRTVMFPEPVAIEADTTYTAAYHAPNGHYAFSAGAFNDSYTNGPLTIPKSGAVYRYPSGRPTTTSTANYWVDVIAII